MYFYKTKISDVILLEPQVFKDERGFFMETWKAQEFMENGIDADFIQDNHSQSIQGTLRGLHYQLKCPQGKLVRVISGEVYDVAVDMRSGSPYFGQWIGELLSSDNKKMLWIPPGFAHGFYVVSETAEMIYKCSDKYNPEYERSVRWDDPDINIDWPLVNGELPILSKKDALAPYFKAAEYY